MARIIAVSPDAGRIHRIDGAECLLGRRLDCHIHINDSRVSRRHARVRRDGDIWQVEDLGSCNGTYVNGRRIQGSVRVRHGDEVEVGASRFRIDLADDIVASVENATVLIGDSPDAAGMSLVEVAHLRQGFTPAQGVGDDAQHALELMQRKLQAMYKMSETVASTLEPRALLDKVTGLLLEVFPQASAAAAVTIDVRTQQLRTQAARRRKGRGRETVPPSMAIPHGVVDRVMRQGSRCCSPRSTICHSPSPSTPSSCARRWVAERPASSAHGRTARTARWAGGWARR